MKFLFDFFPILLFFVAYKLYDIYVATAVAIVAAAVQTAAFWIRHRRFEKMHLVTFGLLLVFGGLTIALHDPVFIKWKPTVINWLFAAVFMGSHWIGAKPLVERMMSHAIQAPRPVWVRTPRTVSPRVSTASTRACFKSRLGVASRVCFIWLE